MNIPVNENLVYKAAQTFFAKIEPGVYIGTGARITLTKEIPTQAGLGGGSSDAAHTLMALNRVFGGVFTVEALLSMAAELGSDVPFFINGSFAFVEGRGEKVMPCEVSSTLELLLIHPPFSISTAWAYGQLKGKILREIPGRAELREALTTALESCNYDMLKSYMKNDIEDVLKESFPEIQEIQDSLMAEGAVGSMLSGSGSAVFGVFKNASARDKATLTLEKKYPDCQLKKAKTLGK